MPETFTEGDTVWINEGQGSQREAVVTSIGDDGRLYAESTRQLNGDSRYTQWIIREDRIPHLVSRREPAV